MVIAKILFGQDNKSFMHEVYPHCCWKCNYPTRQEINTNFQLMRKNYDVSYTGDGYMIVSERFRYYCMERNLNNIIFNILPNEPNFYCVTVTKPITLDYAKRGVKLIDKCSVCGRYAEVIGATPSFLDEEKQILVNEFYRSDISFGSFESKSPLIILNTLTATELQKQRFNGLYFKDVIKS